MSWCIGVALVFIVLTCSGCDTSKTQPEPRWNVLVVVPDTVRADHLGINGYARDTTPNLDQLARDGTNFTQAITAAPRTWQSFTTILSGLYPPHHGVRFIFDFPLDPSTPTMATELRKLGYAARAFDRVHFIRAMTGGHGFEAYQDNILFGDDLVIDQAWTWIAEQKKRPFFCFIRINGPHWPYKAKPEDVADFDSCDGQDHHFNDSPARMMGLGPGIRGKGITLAHPEAYKKVFYDVNVTPRQLRHRIAHYDAELRRTDRYMGRLFDEMRANGLMKKTVVVVTSDHGESFGEHGYWQHGPRVDEPVARVPLILRLPEGHRSRKAGTTIDGLVRTVDILPTVLAAVGAPIPQHLDGINLLPFVEGQELPALWAYAESGKDYVGVDPELYLPGVAGKHRMIRTADWKLIYIPKPEGAETRLFDLRADPQERHDVFGQHPEKVKELYQLLVPFLKLDRAEVGREREPSEAEKERLRQLGYM